MLHLNQKFQGVGHHHHHKVSSLGIQSRNDDLTHSQVVVQRSSTLFLENRNNVSTDGAYYHLPRQFFKTTTPSTTYFFQFPQFSLFQNAASFDICSRNFSDLSILVRHRWQTAFNIWVLHGTFQGKTRPYFLQRSGFFSLPSLDIWNANQRDLG